MRKAFVLLRIALFLSASTIRAQQPPEAPNVAADAVADSRIRLVRETGGHAGTPRQVAFTSDGGKLVSAADDRTVQVWDVATRERLRVIRPPIGVDGQGGLAQHLVLDRKGERVAFWVQAKDDKGELVRTIFVCRLDRDETRTIPGAGRLAFASDGKSLVVAERHKLSVIDIETGKVQQSAEVFGEKSKDGLIGVACSPNGLAVAVAATDGKTYLYDSTSLKRQKVLSVPGIVNLGSVSWADDKTLLLRTYVAQKLLLVMDAETGKVTKTYSRDVLLAPLPKGQATTDKLVEAQAIPQSTKAFVRAQVALPNGNWANLSYVLDWSTGNASPAYVRRSAFVCSAAAVSADLKVAAQGDGDLNDIILWNPEDGKALVDRKTERRLRASVRGADGSYKSVRWRPDGAAVCWRNLYDGKDRGSSELDLGTLTLAPTSPKTIGDYSRGIVKESGPLSVVMRHPNLEIAGGTQAVTFPIWPNGPVRWDFTFVGDRRVAAEGWNSPVVQIFDSATGKRLFATRVVHSYIQSWAVSPRPSRLLLIGSSDQTLTIYNPATGKVILTVFPAGADWIAWTPEGYYAATPGGERLMGWHVENGPDRLASFYPADRFRNRLYRPDILKSILEKGDVQAAAAAANAALKKEDKSPPPTGDLTRLLPPRTALEIVDRQSLPALKVRARAVAASDGQPVVAMRLLVDGRPLAGACSASYGKGQPRVEEEWTLTIPPGKHHLAVLARSADASTVSSPVELTFVDPEKQPILHVLTIGIDSYADRSLALSCAAADAKDLAAAFKNNSRGDLFREVETTTLVNGDARKPAILDAVRNLRKKVRPNDLAVVFFAGHGIKDKDKFYLLPVEAKTNDLATTALSGAELHKALGEFPCQVLLMLDACHASGSLAAFRPAVDDVTRTLTDDDCGVAILCAAMAHEKAIEKNGNGLFTKAIVEALSQSDGVPFNRSNRIMYVHHLHSYVVDAVSEESAGKQHPFLSLPWVVEPFALRRLPDRGIGGP